MALATLTTDMVDTCQDQNRIHRPFFPSVMPTAARGFI